MNSNSFPLLLITHTPASYFCRDFKRTSHTHTLSAILSVTVSVFAERYCSLLLLVLTQCYAFWTSLFIVVCRSPKPGSPLTSTSDHAYSITTVCPSTDPVPVSRLLKPCLRFWIRLPPTPSVNIYLSLSVSPSPSLLA